MQDIERFLLNLYQNVMQTQWVQNHILQINAALWAAGICLIYGVIMLFWNAIEGTDHHPKRFFTGSLIIISLSFFLATPFITWFNHHSDLMKLLIILAGIILVVIAWIIIKNIFSNKEWKEELERSRQEQEEIQRKLIESENSLPPEIRQKMQKWRLEHEYMVICDNCKQWYNEIESAGPHCGTRNPRREYW